MSDSHSPQNPQTWSRDPANTLGSPTGSCLYVHLPDSECKTSPHSPLHTAPGRSRYSATKPPSLPLRPSPSPDATPPPAVCRPFRPQRSPASTV
ncbi:TPA: hypothetical protein ACS73L_003858, partial [Providencia alcalifaciens]